MTKYPPLSERMHVKFIISYRIQYYLMFIKFKVCVKVSEEILALAMVSNMGSRTNLMKPICAVGLVTFSRSMNGATGKPSSFSRSDYDIHHNNNNTKFVKVQPLYYHLPYVSMTG